ncbi:hypothetical protein ACTFIR_005691 [Dictyostelium discoideum]
MYCLCGTTTLPTHIWDNSYNILILIFNNCLNCGKSNHKVDTYGVDPVDYRVYPEGQLAKNYKISQYHHLEDYDFPVNKDSLYTLNSFYNQNIVTQLHQQIPDTTVPIPKAVESEMKYKPQKIEFYIPTELTNVDDKNYTRLNSNKELINDEEDEMLYTIKFDKETNKPIISLLHSAGTSDTSLIPTL